MKSSQVDGKSINSTCSEAWSTRLRSRSSRRFFDRLRSRDSIDSIDQLDRLRGILTLIPNYLRSLTWANSNPYINLRTTRGGGGVPPPWRFSPITFLMIPTGKIASVYLLLGIEDTFWHMWHHLDAVTWHMSWRQQSMTIIDENTVVLPLYVCHDIFRSICDKAKRLVLFLTFSRSGNSKMLK